ncbi:hypothetical protein OAX78_03545 [Planctomycetota bacterium]|nr:hypothetical protein [Planctomycetota bacterium]
MSDERLRGLERRWKETQAVEDEAAFLLERVRVGDLEQEKLELAGFCGSASALLALGVRRDDIAISSAVAGEFVAATLELLGRVYGAPWPELYRPFVRLFRRSARSGSQPTEQLVRGELDSFMESTATVPGASWQNLYPPAWGAEALTGHLTPPETSREGLFRRILAHGSEHAGPTALEQQVLSPVTAWCLADSAET